MKHFMLSALSLLGAVPAMAQEGCSGSYGGSYYRGGGDCQPRSYTYSYDRCEPRYYSYDRSCDSRSYSYRQYDNYGYRGSSDYGYRGSSDYGYRGSNGYGDRGSSGYNNGGYSSGNSGSGGNNSRGNNRHGNNGVGNGYDPQPPGNPPINDGRGTGPGNPGRRHGGR